MRKLSQFFPERRNMVNDFNQKSPIISGLGATRTLLDSEAGSTVLLDRAAGIVLTLPNTAANASSDLIGAWFEFIATVSVTSNAYKIITGAATEFVQGSLTNIDTDTTNAVAAWTGNGTSHIAVNMTAAATNALGGLLGTRLRLTCLSATLWQVDGTVQGAGTVATPFSTT